ncbi:MAG TPA: hypothetical protein VF172_02695 [Nitrososphaera sp.]
MASSQQKKGKRKSSNPRKVTLGQEALELHKRLRGKIEIRSKVTAKLPRDIGMPTRRA